MTPEELRLVRQKFPVSDAVARRSCPNENHPRTKVCDAKLERNKAKPLVEAVSGKKESVDRVIVCITGYRVRPLDPDNFAGGTKDIIDGLRHAGLLDDDSPDKIILRTEQVKIRHRENQKTVVTIEYPLP